MLSENNSCSNYTQFTMTGKIAISGNCNALQNKDDLNSHLKQLCGCGYRMLYNCTGLTQEPELQATTLTLQCYSYMFSGCSNLNYIKYLATDIYATNCTSNNWVEGVAETGIFVKEAGVNWTTGYDGIPSGWTVIEE